MLLPHHNNKPLVETKTTTKFVCLFVCFLWRVFGFCEACEAPSVVWWMVCTRGGRAVLNGNPRGWPCSSRGGPPGPNSVIIEYQTLKFWWKLLWCNTRPRLTWLFGEYRLGLCVTFSFSSTNTMLSDCAVAIAPISSSHFLNVCHNGKATKSSPSNNAIAIFVCNDAKNFSFEI